MGSLARELKALADGHKLPAFGWLPDPVRVEAEERARAESDKAA